MKHWSLILISFLVTTAQASQWVIDSQLMNKDTWAEPIFNTQDPKRNIATETPSAVTEPTPSQYLEVRKVIPFSEPSVPKSWVEYKILNEPAGQ